MSRKGPSVYGVEDGILSLERLPIC
ncbi:unnamed protein product, partial [Vitis vinifera]|uniref:Uncharacterized protein n=1 Tax=Vitis vinifera TaxID=29760 RepID=D7T221_VITVI